MKYIAKANLDSFFKAVSEIENLYIPSDVNGSVTYAKYEDGVKMSEALNTTRSAKDFFFPQTENLVDFKLNGKNLEIIDSRKEAEDFAVFGVRACDARSFTVLDNVFIKDEKFVDTYYKNRRDHGLIISMACTHPAETCFCQTFGIDATDPDGDIAVYPTKDGYYFKAKTEKGEALMSKTEAVFEEKDESAKDEQQAATKEILSKLPLANVKSDSFGTEDKLMKFFSSPKWAELSQSCLGCGACTYVCPTCQCYDIKDYDTGHGIKRFRTWDSCMFSDFTQMAGGQPRLTQLERFRQRFMHKLVYYPSRNNGLFGCVGCGRCISKCPISMNIVKVMKTLED